MSQRMVLTVSDLQYEWLQEVRRNRGLENTQEAVRSILEDEYRRAHIPKAVSGMKRAVGINA